MRLCVKVEMINVCALKGYWKIKAFKVLLGRPMLINRTITLRGCTLLDVLEHAELNEVRASSMVVHMLSDG